MYTQQGRQRQLIPPTHNKLTFHKYLKKRKFSIRTNYIPLNQTTQLVTIILAIIMVGMATSRFSINLTVLLIIIPESRYVNRGLDLFHY